MFHLHRQDVERSPLIIERLAILQNVCSSRLEKWREWREILYICMSDNIIEVRLNHSLMTVYYTVVFIMWVWVGVWGFISL